jgi:hypothetical protein
MEQPFDGQALGEQLVGIVREFVTRKNAELTRAFEDALVNYAGVYETGRCYPAGAVVAHGGGLWRAAYKTASRPGEGQAWAPHLHSKEIA